MRIGRIDGGDPGLTFSMCRTLFLQGREEVQEELYQVLSHHTAELKLADICLHTHTYPGECVGQVGVYMGRTSGTHASVELTLRKASKRETSPQSLQR